MAGRHRSGSGFGGDVLLVLVLAAVAMICGTVVGLYMTGVL